MHCKTGKLVGLGDESILIFIPVQEEGAQGLALAELARCKLALLLLGLGEHAKLAGADVELVVVLGVHKASGLSLALQPSNKPWSTPNIILSLQPTSRFLIFSAQASTQATGMTMKDIFRRRTCSCCP